MRFAKSLSVQQMVIRGKWLTILLLVMFNRLTKKGLRHQREASCPKNRKLYPRGTGLYPMLRESLLKENPYLQMYSPHFQILHLESFGIFTNI